MTWVHDITQYDITQYSYIMNQWIMLCFFNHKNSFQIQRTAEAWNFIDRIVVVGTPVSQITISWTIQGLH